MTAPNTFLQGSFAPVAGEITAFDLPVTGQVPAELTGRYLRNGPNPLGLDEPDYRLGEGHWFLGAGMVHGVRLRDGPTGPLLSQPFPPVPRPRRRADVGALVLVSSRREGNPLLPHFRNSVSGERSTQN